MAGPSKRTHRLALVCALVVMGGLLGFVEASTNPQWVLGYYVGYYASSLPIANIDWSGLTHIAMAPLLVDAPNSLDLSFDIGATGASFAAELANAARAHGVVPLLMLGGAGAGANISIAMQPANKATFINNLLSVMNQLNYSGIDLDWEDSVTVSGLISLASALRAAKPDIVLSYPGGMINPNIDTVDPNYATLANSLDRFFVQSYYPDTAVAGPGTGWNSWFISPLSGSTANTPIAIDDTLSRYVAVGVPTAKLGMGIAFYAICYTGGVSGPRQSTSSSSIVGGDNNYPLSSFYATGSTYDSAPTGALQFDSIAKSSYLSYTTAVFDSFCNANTRYLSFETPTSIQAKGNFSIANGYGGIIIWNLNEGYISGSAHPNLLTQALKTAFIDPAGTTTTSTVSTSSSSSAATTTTKSPTTTTATTSHPTTSTTSTTTTGGGSSGAVFIHHSWGLLALACFVVLAFNFIC